MAIERQNTGFVYRGREDKCHIDRNGHDEMGQRMSDLLTIRQRAQAIARGDFTEEEAWNTPLCPGCYMEVGFWMMIALAKANGQSLRELGRTMAQGFAMLADNPDAPPAFLPVVLDSET